MSVLFCCWGSICESGISRAFSNLGYNVISFNETCTNQDLDADYIHKLADIILNNSDIEYVFSVNYIPIIAKTCTIIKKLYLSWVVDSPSYTLYSKSLESVYCHTFLFDYNLYEKFVAYFPNNVHYLALGGDVEFYDSVSLDEQDYEKYRCDVSFVGSFHTENCGPFDNTYIKLPEYMKGYIDGLIDSQLKIYGYYLIDELIDDRFAESFREYANYTTLPDYIMDSKGIVSDHYIGFKCNQLDRIRTLQRISEHYNIDLYTNEDTSAIPEINNRGIADSETMMPKIFKCSKINLNITAKTIKTGIPQRIFDIMSAGGFVISNYQTEIAEYFIPGEDIIMYENIDDLIQKIEYYLNNEKERMRIANNGYMKVKENYSYTAKLAEMFNILRL